VAEPPSAQLQYQRTPSDASSSISSLGSFYVDMQSNGSRYDSDQTELESQLRRGSINSSFSSFTSPYSDTASDWKNEMSGCRDQAGPCHYKSAQTILKKPSTNIESCRGTSISKEEVGICSKSRGMYSFQQYGPQIPCDPWPEKRQSESWNDVNWQLGLDYSIMLCPASQSLVYRRLNKYDVVNNHLQNGHLREMRQLREIDLSYLGSVASEFCQDRDTWPFNLPEYDIYQHMPVALFRGCRYSSATPNFSATATASNECLLDIIWESIHRNSSCEILERFSGMEAFVSFLNSAACYQAKSQTVITHLSFFQNRQALKNSTNSYIEPTDSHIFSMRSQVLGSITSPRFWTSQHERFSQIQ
jgi:hypothetical protein